MIQNIKAFDKIQGKIKTSEEIKKKFYEALKNDKLEDFIKEQGIDFSSDEIKEYITKTYDIQIKELSELELNNVSGGCTTYSSGIDGPYGVRPYVIVTEPNSCPGGQALEIDMGRTVRTCCGECKHHLGTIPMYCEVRWRGHERLVDPTVYYDGVFIDGEKNW